VNRSGKVSGSTITPATRIAASDGSLLPASHVEWDDSTSGRAVRLAHRLRGSDCFWRGSACS
jgi:hypothetical protein